MVIRRISVDVIEDEGEVHLVPDRRNATDRTAALLFFEKVQPNEMPAPGVWSHAFNNSRKPGLSLSSTVKLSLAGIAAELLLMASRQFGFAAVAAPHDLILSGDGDNNLWAIEPPVGIEPTTFRLQGGPSSQLR